MMFCLRDVGLIGEHVRQSHFEELLVAIAVMLDSRIVDVDKAQRGWIERPLGERAAIKQYFEFFCILSRCSLKTDRLGHILDTEENSCRLAVDIELPGIQQHAAGTDILK